MDQERGRQEQEQEVKGSMEDMGRASMGNNSNVWKGLAAGLAGGLIASWTMNRFQDAWTTLTAGSDESRNILSQVVPEAAEDQQDDTTVKAAAVVSENLFHHKLRQNEKALAGAAVHYSLGTTVGGMYGAVAELWPEATAGAGLPFGTAFWLVVDEGAVPILGLAKGPAEYPLSTHAYALASHLVFGLTTEMVRRAVRRLW